MSLNDRQNDRDTVSDEEARRIAGKFRGFAVADNPDEHIDKHRKKEATLEADREERLNRPSK